MAVIQESGIDLIVEEITDFKTKPNDDELAFGHEFTDRMLLQKYKNNQWLLGKILPFQNFSLSPATQVLHYGQEIFEGMKAFHQVNGNRVMFRPDENAKRFRRSAKRMEMPQVPEDYFIQSIAKLVELEKDWIPKKRGTALYIRPTMIATEPVLGVRPSEEYYFFTILSPSGPYFPGGFSPTKIKVEDFYVRAALGGTGDTKAGGNYAASLIAARKAKQEGYSQVLWLDAKEHKFAEEVGAMNIAFVMDGTIYTPPLTGTILPGITRLSVIQLAKDLGIPIKEEALSIDTIVEGLTTGNLTEIFGIGTAASIAPIGEIKYNNTEYLVNNNQIGSITRQMYDELLGIQYGNIEDRHGWIYLIEQ